MEFIDTHSHLTDEAFNNDRDEVIKRSFKSGVSKIIEIACSWEDWDKAVEICKIYKDSIYACFGIHPHYPDQLSAKNIDKLKGFLNLEVSKGLGEIGLDYYWDASKKTARLNFCLQ